MRMRGQQQTQDIRARGTLLALLLLGLFLAQLLFVRHAAAIDSSSLSRWLSSKAIPEISEILAKHPRFAQQRVVVSAAGYSSLDSAVVTVLVGHLGAVANIALAEVPDTSKLAVASIDDLVCEQGAELQPQLTVSIEQVTGRKGRVVVALLDSTSPDSVWRRWEWQGNLSREEQKSLASTTDVTGRNGTLAAPWSEDSVQEAATALSIELACDLRVQVQDRVAVTWRDVSRQSAQLGDVFNVSRHLLGNLREIDLYAQGGDLNLSTRVESFQGDVLQIWLIGTSESGKYEPVQAVTYMRRGAHEAQALPSKRSVESPVASVDRKSIARVKPDTAARDSFQVRMVDVSQADKAFSGAELNVQLQLVNRAQWPIQYAFSLSGGHYLHCVPKPEFYRHDRYGYLEGEVPAGGSLIRSIKINDVQHNPNPWFGQQKCAGFKDLEGFENFSGKGYKVTNFVRWRM